MFSIVFKHVHSDIFLQKYVRNAGGCGSSEIKEWLHKVSERCSELRNVFQNFGNSVPAEKQHCTHIKLGVPYCVTNNRASFKTYVCQRDPTHPTHRLVLALELVTRGSVLPLRSPLFGHTQPPLHKLLTHRSSVSVV